MSASAKPVAWVLSLPLNATFNSWLDGLLSAVVVVLGLIGEAPTGRPGSALRRVMSAAHLLLGVHRRQANLAKAPVPGWPEVRLG
jgi:hypothetical protein